MPHHNPVDKFEMAGDELRAGMQPVGFHQIPAAGIILHSGVAQGQFDAPVFRQSLPSASFQPQFGKLGILRQRAFNISLQVKNYRCQRPVVPFSDMPADMSPLCDNAAIGIR
ncbi:MAG TPA: hypothetical protein VGH23_07085 [Rhizomicrobium sp.]|jgi:hypothetical protein